MDEVGYQDVDDSSACAGSRGTGETVSLFMGKGWLVWFSEYEDASSMRREMTDWNLGG